MKENVNVSKVFTMLFVLFSMIVLNSCSVKTAKFEHTVDESYISFSGSSNRVCAYLTITSTCISGRYYDSDASNDFVALEPSIVLSDGTEIEGYTHVGNMNTTIDIKSGDKVQRVWWFYLPDDFLPGAYDVKLVSINAEQIIENVEFFMNEQ